MVNDNLDAQTRSGRTPPAWRTCSLTAAALTIVGGLAAGCGATTHKGPTVHQAGPAGVDKIPEPATPGFSGLAFGRPTKARSVQSNVDLDRYLKPELREAEARAQAPAKPDREPARPSEPALPTAPTAPAEPAARSSVARAKSEQLASAAPAAIAARGSSNPLDNDARKYAEREAQASEQMEYRGGDAIVISAGTLIVVLLVVILVLLLT